MGEGFKGIALLLLTGPGKEENSLAKTLPVAAGIAASLVLIVPR